MQRTKINEKYVVELTPDEKSELRRMTATGRESSRKFRRAHALLLGDAGRTDKEIREILGVSLPTIERARKRFVEGGLDLALNENPRIGRIPKVDGKVEAHLIALACSNPPTGRALEKKRTYTGEADLTLLQNFNTAAIAGDKKLQS